VWRYRAGPDAETSRVLIQDIEANPHAGRIVHIRLLNFKVRAPKHPGGWIEIWHLPFAEEALRTSLTSLERESHPIDQVYWDRRSEFASALLEGKAGVFREDLRTVLGQIAEFYSRP
jgi:hypothetical protein